MKNGPLSRSGGYRLGPEIACGGTARLNLGERQSAGGWRRPVLIKRLLPPFQDTPDYRRLLQQEAAILGRLSHPNIVQIYDFAEIDGTPCLILEPVDGMNLAQFLAELRRAGKPLPALGALSLLLQLLQALQYLHRADPRRQKPAIVHRDLSPDNLLLTRDGHLKLADFGISLPLDEGKALAPPWGKLRYASPEQRRGLPLNEKSDLYSLGLIAEEWAKEVDPAAAAERSLLGRIADQTRAADPAARGTAEGLIQLLHDTAPAALSRGGPLLAQLWRSLDLTDQTAAHKGRRPTLPLLGSRLLRPAAWRSAAVLAAGAALSALLLLWPRPLPRSEIPFSPFPATAAGDSSAIAPADLQGTSDRGRLDLRSTPVSTVYINGKRFGLTPLSDLRLPAGRYQITFHSPEYALQRQRSVQLLPGQRLKVHEIFEKETGKRWSL